MLSSEEEGEALIYYAVVELLVSLEAAYIVPKGLGYVGPHGEAKPYEIWEEMLHEIKLFSAFVYFF